MRTLLLLILIASTTTNAGCFSEEPPPEKDYPLVRERQHLSTTANPQSEEKTEAIH